MLQKHVYMHAKKV